MTRFASTRRVLAGVLLLLALGAAAAWLVERLLLAPRRAALQQVQELQSVLQTRSDHLLGYTAYTSYLTAGEKALEGQARLLTARVLREEGETQVLERRLVPGVVSSGTVAVWFRVEYAFGFDLAGGGLRVRAVPGGIEVAVPRPALVAAPAVTQLRYKVLSPGMLTDEKAATLALYEKAAERARRQGEAMASDPAVVALCEKQLVGFLRNFLQQQPGVQVVPQISIVYRPT